ncbi:MAG: LysR substrate-binding domain-containing protein [Vicinamibacterales bacterium]
MTPPKVFLASFGGTRRQSELHACGGTPAPGATGADTKRIQQLERALGLSLFVRTRRSVRLSSAAGELLLPKARQVLRSLDNLDGCARRLHRQSFGRLYASTFARAPHHVLPRLMRAFRVEEHPGVECLLSELPGDQQLDQLFDGEIDVGILRHSHRPSRIALSRLPRRNEYMAVLPRNHALAARRSVLLSKLTAQIHSSSSHANRLQACTNRSAGGMRGGRLHTTLAARGDTRPCRRLAGRGGM